MSDFAKIAVVALGIGAVAVWIDYGHIERVFHGSRQSARTGRLMKKGLGGGVRNAVAGRPDRCRCRSTVYGPLAPGRCIQTLDAGTTDPLT